MKRKLIYSVSICALAFTLVSAILADKPTKVVTFNVPGLYDPIGKMPSPFPETIPSIANDNDEVWTVKNSTGCGDLDVDVYFGVNDGVSDLSPDLETIKFYDIAPGATKTITVGNIKNQYSGYGLTPPFSISHGYVRIKWSSSLIWPSIATSIKMQAGETPNPKRFTNPDTNVLFPCNCVKIFWNFTAHQIELLPCL